MATSPDRPDRPDLSDGSGPVPVESAADLAPDVRRALRDLLLVLADSKRLLGFRYAGWILGAPELESGIACAAMAQDEWGHARLTYALLEDFGDDVAALEHGRAPHQYCSMAVLDREPDDWAGLIALNALADTALTVQFEALRDCRYLPLRQRIGKLLAEERYHAAHGAAWARRYLRAGAAARARFAETLRAVLPPLLVWFGPEAGRGGLFAGAGVCDASPDTLRERFLARIAPVLELAEPEVRDFTPGDVAFSGFDEVRRRSGASGGQGSAALAGLAPAEATVAVAAGVAAGDAGCDGPDLATVERLRGDRNRAFLLD